MQELQLSRKELKTLFYVGRKLALTHCLVGAVNPPSPRTVAARKSYGFEMQREDGRLSRMEFETGYKIVGLSPAGNGFTAVKIVTPEGRTAAEYELL